MNIDINSLTFTATINNIYDDTMEKLNEITMIEMEFIRKFENRASNPESHASMIFFIRNTLIKCEQFFQDLKGYFSQLNLNFAYDLFRKMHLLLITGYNYTSEAFSAALAELNKEPTPEQQSKELRKAIAKRNATNNFKKLEEAEFIIKSLEAEEGKMNRDILQLYTQALAHKHIVEKMKPSNTLKQISEIKDCVDSIISHAQSTFQQAYMDKYKEFKKYIMKLSKPEDVSKIFCHQMEQSMKDKFMEGMTKAAFRLKQISKDQIVKMQTLDQAMQTDKVPTTTLGRTKTNPHDNRKGTEKHFVQLEHLRKAQLSTAKENADLIRKHKQLQQKYEQAKRNYESLKSLYESRSDELETFKTSTEFVVQQKLRHIEKLRGEVNNYRAKRIKVDMGIQANVQHDTLTCNNQVQTEAKYLIADCEGQMIRNLKANNEKFMLKLSRKQSKLRQLEREIKENGTLREQFGGIINSVCNDLKLDLIEQYERGSLKSLVRRTSQLMDTFKAERLSKQILVNSTEFRCSIDQNEKQSVSNHDQVAQSRISTRRARRRETIVNSIGHMASVKRRIVPGSILQNRTSTTFKRSIECQTDQQTENMEATTRALCGKKNKHTQTDNPSRQPKNSKFTKFVSRTKRIQANNNTTVTQKKNYNRARSQPKQSQNASLRNQSQKDQKDCLQNRLIEPQRTNFRANLMGAKTATHKWRQKLKSSDGLECENVTNGFRRPSNLEKVFFETIEINQNKPQIPRYRQTAKDTSETLGEKSRQLQTRQTKISRQQKVILIEKASENVKCKKENPHQIQNIKQGRDSEMSICMSSLFKVTKLEQNSARKCTSPRNLLYTMNETTTEDKFTEKRVAFKVIECRNAHTVDSLISNLIVEDPMAKTPFQEVSYQKKQLRNRQSNI